MNIFKDPVLFHALGTDWQLSKFCLPCGFFLMIVAGFLFWILVRHTNTKAHRLDAAQAANVAFNAGRGPGEIIVQDVSGKAGGAGVQISMSIDEFRRAAERGDWVTFWLFPIVISCWVAGMWLVFSAFILSMPVVWVVVSLLMSVLLLPMPYMMWAALYTDKENPRLHKQGSPSPAALNEPKDGGRQ